MALRKLLFLNSTEGASEEENATADEAQMGKLTLSGISGVGLSLSNTLISNVATPVNPADAATKAYVDGSAGSASIKQVEIDCGATPVGEATALFSDTSVTVSSKIVYCLSGQAPTGKDMDETTMDDIKLVVSPLASQVQVYIRGLEGYIHDKFKIAYTVG